MEEIKVKYFVDGIDELCYVAGKSDWIDLHAAEDVDMKAGEFRLIPLGVAIELPDGTVVTGKNGPLLGAASSALLNALKKLAGIDHEIDLVSARAIEPIQTLKTNYLGSRNPRLHTDEILIALSSSAAENETAAVALQQLSKLKGCDMHSTVILSSVDTDTIKRLGMYLTCEPAYEQEDRKYHKK